MELHSPKRAAGFSLIEVLVTIVVVSFGLLGLAALLVKGIEFSNSSYMRTVATQQAYDMADRMRANAKGLLDGRYDAVTFSAPTTCGACTTCTPEALAIYDICSWNSQNASLLPSGQGTVTKNNLIWEIAVSWDSSRSGSADETFTLRVEP